MYWSPTYVRKPYIQEGGVESSSPEYEVRIRKLGIDQLSPLPPCLLSSIFLLLRF